MMEIQKRALARSLAMLDGAQVEYIVRFPDGTQVVRGNLKLAEDKKPNRLPKAPHGTYKNVYEPILKDMNVGDVRAIEFNGMSGRALQASLTGWCAQTWGVGSALTHLTKNSVEVMRVA